jgi:hypothetical protein
MKHNLKKLGLEFVSGYFCSILAYLPTSMICFFFINTDNCGVLFITLFSAYPIGSIVGILLIEKIYFKSLEWNIPAIGIGLASGLVGGYLDLLILEIYQDIFYLFIPLIITSLVLVVYNIFSLYHFRSAIRFD